jgi:hypothetical protein
MIPERFPFHPEHIPACLKAGRCWEVCDEAKIPLVAGSLRRASTTNPLTWRSYEAAVGAYRARPPRCAGVGRVIRADEGLIGIDLDNCRDPQTGRIGEAAQEILREIGSYSEVSPSGRGIKIWCRGRLDRSYIKPGVEVYVRGRYFTTTGSFLPQYPGSVEERQEEIIALVEREFPRPGRGASAVTGGPYHGPEVSLGAFLERVEVFAELRDSLGIKFAIRCPWAAQHSSGDESGTYVGRRTGGGCWFRCWHAHCSGRTWRDFKRAVRSSKARLKGVSVKVNAPGYSGHDLEVSLHHE